jgi:predicted ATP-grasp superfamily ATP-dependent carboligase
MRGAYSNKAVILSLYDTGLAAVRCLGRLGIEVIAYDYDPSQPGFRSRYCKAVQCPNPTDNPQALLDLLLQNADTEKPMVLFPCSDEFVLFVSRHREALEKSYKFLLPDHAFLETLISKDSQSTIVQALGISVPKSFTAKSMGHAEKSKDKIRFPVFIKPVQGYLWRRHYDNKGFVASNQNELLDLCQQIFAKGIKVIVQEIIPGPASNNWEVSAYVDSKGRLLGEFIIRKIRQYPSDFGFATMTVSAHNPEVEKLGQRLIEGLVWRGFINMEFKFDPTDKTYKFIELNPRVWQQVNHAEKLGLNFPLLQYLDMLGIENKTAKTYREGVKWLDLKWDTISSLKKIMRKEMTVWQWIGSLVGAQIEGLFSLDDMHPFLYSLGYGAIFLKIPKVIFKAFCSK